MVRAMSELKTGAALVTGAGSRIGRAIALDLAASELAVLSVCETNLGVRRGGQGLQFLRRAMSRSVHLGAAMQAS